MSTSAVSSTDLFLSKPYHPSVNSWLKRNFDAPPFTLTNVRGIHHLPLFEQTSRLWAKWKKFLHSIFTESECLTGVAATGCITFKGKWPLSSTVCECYLQMTLIVLLNFDHFHKRWSYKCSRMSHWIKSVSLQGERGSSISQTQRPCVHKSL